MSGKLYQVFISATYLDLVEERKVLNQVLPQLGCFPVGAEPHAPGVAAWPALKKLIDESDYYLVLLGSRYGSLTPTGISFTHQEYVYATAKHKPILVLMHEAPESRALELQEKTAEGRIKFNDFRQLLSRGLLKYWDTPGSIEVVLRESLPRLIQTRPMPGLVRAGQVVSNPALEKELAQARARITELEAERDQWLLVEIKPQALAQGREFFELQFECKAYAGGNCEQVTARSRLSWNDIFLSMAPYLLQPQTEEFMHDKLAARLKESVLSDVQKVKPKTHAVTDVEINPLTFNTIKIQLRSLGLITRIRNGHQEGHMEWQLSLAGERHMTQLLTVFKQSVANH